MIASRSQDQTHTFVALNERPDAVIDRRADLDFDTFSREYLRPLRPVVIPRALYGLAAMGRWTPDFFLEEYGSKPVVAGINGGIREYTLREHLELIQASTPSNPAPYLFNFLVDEQFPELMPDLTPWPRYMNPNWLANPRLPRPLRSLARQLRNDTRPGLFLGGLGSRCPQLHYDFGYHSFSMQFFGRKKFYLYSSDQTPLMYPATVSRCLSEVENVEEPDLERFPKFRDTQPITCILEPGDLLFLPGGWWHTTILLDVSISVSVNTANAPCWSLALRERYEQMRSTHPRLAGPITGAIRRIGWLRGFVERLGGRY